MGRFAALAPPLAALAGTVLIGVLAFRLSFSSLTDLAARAGVPISQAPLWPLAVDGSIVVVTIAALTLERRRARAYAWTLLVASSSVSLVGNAIHATLVDHPSVSSFVAVSVAVIPPSLLLGVTHFTALLAQAAQERSRPTPIEWEPLTLSDITPLIPEGYSLAPTAPTLFDNETERLVA